MSGAYPTTVALADMTITSLEPTSLSKPQFKAPGAHPWRSALGHPGKLCTAYQGTSRRIVCFFSQAKRPV